MHRLTQRQQRLQGIRMIGPCEATLLGQRLLECDNEPACIAALGVDEPEHLLQLGPHQRGAAQLREGLAFGAREKLANGDSVPIRANRRVGGLEQVDEHLHDLFRFVTLERGDAPLHDEGARLR